MRYFKQLATLAITLTLFIAPLAFGDQHKGQDYKHSWVEKDGFWTGGVGQDAREYLPEGNAQFTFNVESGSFLADIHFIVEGKDSDYKLEGTSTGPLVVTDLEPGEYYVKAHRGDEAQGHHFRVEDDGQVTIGLTFSES